jgi:hypothetical protein
MPSHAVRSARAMLKPASLPGESLTEKVMNQKDRRGQ